MIKGVFEGNEAAKSAIKMDTIEMGVKAGNTVSNIGSGLLIFGAIDGNPALIVIGLTIDTLSQVIKLSFMI